MKIYISSSWKNKIIVRTVANLLEKLDHSVYDFTNPNCRKSPEIPPEKFPEQFDPNKHYYPTYINKKEWYEAVNENKKAIEWCDIVFLLLPCGIDATADWAYGVGLGKKSIIIGHPKKGEGSPVHLWADKIVDNINEAIECLKLF